MFLRDKTVKSKGRECKCFETGNKFSNKAIQVIPAEGIKEGVLQSVFSCSKESGRHTPYSGPQSFKQKPEELQVQNADA